LEGERALGAGEGREMRERERERERETCFIQQGRGER